jgi:ferredoxin
MSDERPEVLHHKSARGPAASARCYRAEVTTINFGVGGRPPTVTLADGRSGQGSCLGCHDTPCMLKSPSESIVASALENFPGDPSDAVCPTEAITWDAARQVIQVDSELCIGCGLCVTRCPYGAIYLEREETAAVLTNDPNKMVAGADAKPSPHVHPAPLRSGRLGRSTSVALTRLPSSIGALSDVAAAVFIRNVLHELGVKCRVRRRGDTNVRIDAVTSFDDGLIGVVEIELTGAVLDSPRALLEDIAILHTRYAMPIGVICPISVVLALPNGRSEYYQVITDIERVLGICCRTFTVGALVLLLWNFAKMPGLGKKLFLTDASGADLLPSLKALLTDLRYDGEPYAAALRTAK